MTDEAVAELVPVTGMSRAACAAAGAPQASYYRRHRKSLPPPRPAGAARRTGSAGALPPAERELPNLAIWLPTVIPNEIDLISRRAG